jgi:hypothetical protein
MPSPVSYEIWRQDDNGNRFLVASFPARETAEQRLAELTRCSHKQTYWIIQQIPQEGEGKA